MKGARRRQENPKAGILGKHTGSPSRTSAKSKKCVQSKTAKHTRVHSPCNVKAVAKGCKFSTSHCSPESPCKRPSHSQRQTSLVPAVLAKAHSSKTSPKPKKLGTHTIHKVSSVKELADSTLKELSTLRKAAKTQRTKKLKSSEGLHPQPWGIDQRQFNHSQQLERIQNNDLLRKKVRSDRHKAKKKGRARIGLGGYKPVCSPQTEAHSPEPVKPAKKSDPRLQKYMNAKKKQAKLEVITSKLQELLRQKEREKALCELDIKSKVSFLPRRKRTDKKSKDITADAQEVLNIAFGADNTDASSKPTPLQENKQEQFVPDSVQLWWKEPPNKDTRRRDDQATHLETDEVRVVHEIEEAEESQEIKETKEIKEIKTSKEIKENEETNGAIDACVDHADSLEELLMQSARESVLADEEVCSLSSHSESFEFSHEESVDEQESVPIFEHFTLQTQALAEEEAEPVQAQFKCPQPAKSLEQFTEKFECDPKWVQEKFVAEAELVLSSEIDTYVDNLTFELKPKEVDASYEFIRSFIDSLFMELLPEYSRILHVLNSPLSPDPSHKLFVLRMAGIGELSKTACFDMVLPPSVLPKLSSKHNPGELESQETYIQFLLECINEALNELRPYGTQGAPMPWSIRPRQVLFQVSLLKVFQQVRARLETWCRLKVGLIGAQPAVQKARTTRQQAAVALEVNEEEEVWLDAEDEAMQTECDLTDMVFEDLIDEIVQVLGPSTT